MWVNYNIESITNKKNFLKRFKDYIKRDVFDVNNMSFKQYEELVLSSKKIICVNNNNSYVSSYKIYDLNDYRSPAFLIDAAKNDKRNIIEKYFSQNKELKKLNEDLVIINIVSTYTDKTDIIASSIKYKENGKLISGNIDIKNKCIKGHLKDEKGLNYSNEFDGFEIPKFDNIISIVKEVSKKTKEIKEVEWSFAIGSRGTIYLLDANPWNDFVFSQTPEFLNNKVGFLPYYKKNKRKLKYY